MAWKKRKRGSSKQKGKSFPIFAQTPKPFKKARIGKGLKQATPFAGANPLLGDAKELMRKAREAKPLLTLKTRELRGQADFNRLADEIMSKRPGMTRDQAERAIATHLKRKYPFLKQREILRAQKAPLERYWREKGEKWRAWKTEKAEWLRKGVKEAPGKIRRGITGPFAGEPYAKPLEVDFKPKVKVTATPAGVRRIREEKLKTEKPLSERLKEALGVEQIKEAARRIRVLPGSAAKKLRRGPPEIIVESEREPSIEVEESPRIEIVVESPEGEEIIEEE